MNPNREIAYRLDPALWMREVLGIIPHAWQERYLRIPRGASVAVLTSRQVGKTTVAACGMAHAAIFMPGSLSVIACPIQNQSGEALRKVRDMVLKAGFELAADNVFKLELSNGSRILALPDAEDSIRGLTVDAWIVADEAARLRPSIMSALHPMRTQRRDARFAILSTAWRLTDTFWSVWASKDPSWIRIDATLNAEPGLIAADVIERAKNQLSDDDFKREYLGIPSGNQVSPFTLPLYERATQSVPDPRIWEFCKPHILAHDVGHTKDRSTAVVGGISPLAPGLTGLTDFKELQQNLSGNARADALATIDRNHNSKSLIIVDLSFDPSYADVLFERFGERVIGLRITSHGEVLDNFERRQVKNGHMLVYKISRTYLLDLLLREMRHDTVRILPSQESIRAYEQLMLLDVEAKPSGITYTCPARHHDDLAMSCAMLVWAAQHPHLPYWCRSLEPRPSYAIGPSMPSGAWT